MACSDLGELAAIARMGSGNGQQVKWLTARDGRHGHESTCCLLECLTRWHGRGSTAGGSCGVFDARLPHRFGGVRL